MESIALRQLGVEAVVFEKAHEVWEIGAGISIWVNAMKALERLGIADAVGAVGRHGSVIRSGPGTARHSRRSRSTLWRRGLASTSF